MTNQTTEQITHNDQILKDVLGPVANVLAYGAKGDGVTDDLPAIRDAVAALVAQGGGTLYIPNTPNGYHIGTGTGCDISNTSGISIVSDGAELKMAAYPNLSSVTGLFYNTDNTYVRDFAMRGLKFSAASVVTRYGNGDTVFDNQVNLGNGDITATTNFRYVILFRQTCERIEVSHCTFDKIYSPAQIKLPLTSSSIRDIRFSNCTMTNVNSFLAIINGASNVTVSDIIATGGMEAVTDHVVYINTGCSHVSISDVTVRDAPYCVAFVTADVQRMAISNVVADNIATLLYFNEGCADITVSNVVVANSSIGFSVFGGQRVRVSGFEIYDCDSAFDYIEGSSGANRIDWFEFSDFLVNNCGIGARIGNCRNLSFRNGQFFNTSNAPAFGNCINLLMRPLTESSSVALDKVNFTWDSYVPTGIVIPVDDSRSVTITDCNFTSLAGTPTASCISQTAPATVQISGCTATGWSGTGNSRLTFPGSVITELVPQPPSDEAVLTANSATPSVAGVTMCVTANTTATSMTNFTGGVQGQEICVRVNDANTTFDFTGTSLKGNNGVDYVASSGDVIFAKLIGSNWHCIISEG